MTAFPTEVFFKDANDYPRYYFSQSILRKVQIFCLAKGIEYKFRVCSQFIEVYFKSSDVNSPYNNIELCYEWGFDGWEVKNYFDNSVGCIEFGSIKNALDAISIPVFNEYNFVIDKVFSCDEI